MARGVEHHSSQQERNAEQTADATKPQQPKKPRSQRLGEKLADVSDVGNKLKDKTERGLDQVKDAPTNVLYGLHRGKQLTKEAAETAKDSFKGRREANQQERDKPLEQRRKQMQERKLAIKPKADPEKPKPTATKPPVEPTRKPTTATPPKPKPEQADTSGQPKRAAHKSYQHQLDLHVQPRSRRRNPPSDHTKNSLRKRFSAQESTDPRFRKAGQATQPKATADQKGSGMKR